MSRPRPLLQVITSSLTLLVLVAAPASAQSLSQRERAYVKGLGKHFGPVTAARRVASAVRFPGPDVVDAVTSMEAHDAPALEQPRSERPTTVRPPAHWVEPQRDGLEVVTDRGTVQRYKFDSPEEAQRAATQLIEEPVRDGARPVIGEVRGTQLVLVDADLARDPAAARAALDAAWKGLPAPPTSDATFAILGPSDIALSTSLKDGPLRESIDKAMEKARQRHDEGHSEFFKPTADGGMAVRHPNGFEADLRSDEHGASALLRRTSDGPVTNEYLALLDPSSDARSADQVRDANKSASEGARNVLDSLFD